MNSSEYKELYHKQHCCCPNCHSKNLNTTIVCYIVPIDHPEEYKDRNSCKCFDCRWSGIVDNLVSDEKDIDNSL